MTPRPKPWAARAGMIGGLQFALLLLPAAGCRTPAPSKSAPVRMPAATQPADAAHLPLEKPGIEPMWREVMPIDLPTVVRVAAADNLEIHQAQQRVRAARGRYESQMGTLLPVLVPTALFEHTEGTVRATEGNLEGVGFNTFTTSIAAKLILNPGKVAYDIIAAKKRLQAGREAQRGVQQEVLRRAAHQYYELLLGQARVQAARESLEQAGELLRITDLRVQKGVGVPADQLQAQARLAQRQQELVTEINRFYNASIDLAVTLHLDPAVTLIPNQRRITQTVLVSDELGVDELLSLAMQHRPEMAEFRRLVEAAGADSKANWWKWFGPQFAIGYQFGGITGHSSRTAGGGGIPSNLIVNPLSATGAFSGNPTANGVIREAILRGSARRAPRRDQTFGFKSQQKANAGAGWRLGVAAFGEQKSANAAEQQVVLAFQQTIDRIRGQVLRARQAGRATAQLIGAARRQLQAAREALRLTEANLKAGMAVTLDVLVAEDAVAQARRQYADAVVRFNQAQIDLVAAVGLVSVDLMSASEKPRPSPP